MVKGLRVEVSTLMRMIMIMKIQPILTNTDHDSSNNNNHQIINKKALTQEDTDRDSILVIVDIQRALIMIRLMKRIWIQKMREIKLY